MWEIGVDIVDIENRIVKLTTFIPQERILHALWTDAEK